MIVVGDKRLSASNSTRRILQTPFNLTLNMLSIGFNPISGGTPFPGSGSLMIGI